MSRKNWFFKSVWVLLILLLLSGMQVVAFNPNIAYASAPAVVSFNGQAAATWALNNVNNPSATGYFDYSSKGGDCTNFVSHALIKGGQNMVGLGTKSTSTNVWWQRDLSWWDANILRKDRNSYSWTFAQLFSQFIINNGKGYIVQFIYRQSASPSPFKVGDIVQISTSRSVNNAHHTMIVTGVSPSGVLVTYRNSSGNPIEKNKNLQSIINKYSKEYFIQIRIK
jgi:hypothetical protein